MKTFLHILILLVSGQMLFSQNQSESVRNFLYDTRGAFYPGKQYFMVAPESTDISGQTFLNEAWQEGAILAHNNERGNAQVRYNVLSDEMQVLVDGEVMALTPGKIKALRIADQIFIPAPRMDENGKIVLGYFELLAEGELELLKRYKCETKPTEYHPAVATAKDVEYVIGTDLYYRWVKDYAKPLKRSKKAVLEIFEGHWDKAEAQAKKEGLNFRKEEDLTRLFLQFNQTVKAQKWN